MLRLRLQTPLATVCTTVRRLTSDGYLHKTRIPTYKFQDSLPTIPIPELDETLDRYLAAVAPLAAEKGMLEATKAAVEAFRTGEGAALQEKLVASQEGVYGSYIAKPWLDMYLESRAGLMIHMNPQLTLKADPEKDDQAARAASLVLSSARFYRTLRDGHLEPDMFSLSSLISSWWMKAMSAVGKTGAYEALLAVAPSGIATKMAMAGGKVPLDMSQYRHLFATTRIPGKGRDALVSSLADDLQTCPKGSGDVPRHISISRGHKLYTLDILDDKGNARSLEEIYTGIAYILEDDNGVDSVPPLGICTAIDRDRWAETRALVEGASEANAAHLATIDGSLFHLTLEDESPRDPFEILEEHMGATGASMSEAITELSKSPETDPFAQLRLFLHGPGTNRWFDKSFSLIVDGKANAAINFEHTWGDGLAVLRFCNEIYADSLATPIPPTLPGPSESGVATLPFDLDGPEVQTAIAEAKVEAEELIGTLDFSALVYKSLGSAGIKAAKLSPDATLQMAIQLAYHRLHGKSGATYEAAAMSYYKHGRTETIRSASSDSDAMCRVFEDPDASKEDKLAAFRKAAATHSKLAREAQMGKGMDRHLFVLKQMAADAGMELPIFTDPLHDIFSTIVVSTSTLPASDALDKGGFGPVSPLCYGVGYGITPDSSHFSVTTFGQDTQAFVDAVEAALDDVVEVIA